MIPVVDEAMEGRPALNTQSTQTESTATSKVQVTATTPLHNKPLNTVYAAIGFSLYAVSNTVAVFTPLLRDSLHNYRESSQMLTLLAIAGVMASILFISRAKPRSYLTSKSWLFGAGALCIQLPIIGLVVHAGTLPVHILFPSWFLFGVGSGLLLLIWMHLFTLGSCKRLTPTLALTTFFAFVWTGLTYLMANTFLAFAITIVFACASLFFALAVFEPEIINYESDEIAPVKPYGLVSLFAFFFCYGLITTHLYHLGRLGELAVVLGAAGGIISYYLIYGLAHREIDPAQNHRVTFVIMVALMIATPQSTGTLEAACCMAGIGVCVFSLLTRTTWLTITSHEFLLDPTNRAARMFLAMALGLFVGFGTGFLIGNCQETSHLCGPLSIVFVTAFAAVGIHYEKNNVDLRLSTLKKLSPVYAEFEQQQKSRHVHELTHRFGLTPREEDVLVLYAQGFSAREIEDALFISGSTVRTHTHHLYQKMGVSSREELAHILEEHARL